MFNAVSAQVVASTSGVRSPQAFSDIAGNSHPWSRANRIPWRAPGASDAKGGQVDAYNGEEQAIGDAKSAGTIGAYRAFIARFPAGSYAELAREALSKLSGEGIEQPAEPAASSQEPPVARRSIRERNATGWQATPPIRNIPAPAWRSRRSTPISAIHSCAAAGHRQSGRTALRLRSGPRLA